MQLGAISRDPHDDGLMWLCAPGLGKVVQAVVAGRQELASLIARRKYREVTAGAGMVGCRVQELLCRACRSVFLLRQTWSRPVTTFVRQAL